MERIASIFEKVKRGAAEAKELAHREDIFILAVIILVGFGGFGLGRLSRTHEGKIPVVIENAAPSDSSVTGGAGALQIADAPGTKNFVASVSGTKYHLPWCASASTIKEENKIWFASEDEARAAGYSPAGNCKGI